MCVLIKIIQEAQYSVNVGRRHHAYKTVWIPFIGETLAVNREEDNLHDCYAAKYLN